MGAIVVLLGTYATASAVVNTWTSYYWDPDTFYDIWWQSDIPETNSSLNQFPSDLRGDIRVSAFQWDEAVIGSDVEFEERCYSCTTAPYDMYATTASFSNEGWTTVTFGRSVRLDDNFEVWLGVYYLDEDADWTNEVVDNDEYWGDVQTVSIHEIGHLNGWQHRCTAGASHTECDPDEGSVMTRGVDGTKRSVPEYDEDQMHAKYGTP